MNFFRRHWYNVGLVVALASIVYLIFAWNGMGILQKVIFMNFIVILLHQFEEYGWPGGEPAILNLVLKSSPTPSYYPLNQNTAMVTNVLVSYVFYLLPLFFPETIWLGLPPILFGLAQFVVHGIVIPKKLGQFYNPGLAAVVLGHIPLALYYLYHIHSTGVVTARDWLFAILYLALFIVVIMSKMTFTWLADKASPYPFDDEELKKFNVEEKLARLIK
ncbi:permease [Paenibacillus sp. BIHB 4019]|uniref:Permease n=1 Tax=Paenibacillus sp. BIHB 4019 TaxID=1870819 RepID=A0A1B2DRI8_9BACL|nr:HXXEE domain-containing protein [Paenibacillus sp. BIHB 4019]ANY70334.1 permease [Paenibacillus sp. BIHB 4019]